MSKLKVTRFYPKEDRLVVLQDKEDLKSAGGIIIPDTAKEKPQRGTVIDIGPEVDNCRPGDVIQYAKYAGNEITFYPGGPEYVILRKNDVSGEIKTFEIDTNIINPDTLKPWTAAEKQAKNKK